MKKKNTVPADIQNAVVLADALSYAEKGWAVYPAHTPVFQTDGSVSCSCGKAGCKIGKHPRTRHGFKDATTDVEKIREYWRKDQDANIGIRTGPESGLFVLDVDTGGQKVGQASLDALEAKFGKLPPTVEAVTGSGGRHLYFKHPGGKIAPSASLIGQDLDIRADDSCVIAPPSMHASGGQYEWTEGHEPGKMELAEVPRWLVNLIRGESPSQKPKGKVKLPKVIKDGQRNDTLTRYAGRLRGQGLDMDEIKPLLIMANQDRCKPPLDDKEIEGIVKSASKWTRGRNHGEEQIDFNGPDVLEAHPYIEAGGKIYYVKPSNQPSFPSELANFTARIIADVVQDDGSGEIQRQYIIKAKQDGNAFQVQCPQKNYSSCQWASEALGAKAIITATQGSSQRLAVAVQKLSLMQQTTSQERQFLHTGWAKIDGRDCYLSVSGAIGADGLNANQTVKLNGALESYCLPEPPSGMELKESVQVLMDLVSVAPNHSVGYALVAAVTRAVLGPCDVSLFLAGVSGSFKSELASLAQSAFGEGFCARNLPANFSDTAYSILAKAFFAKDSVLVVDDFVPTGGPQAMKELQRKAEQLFRGVGNRQGRGRLNSKAEQRPERPPRCFVIATGEERVQGFSLLARMFIIEIHPGDVDTKKLTECQRQRSKGSYSKALSGFVRYLAGSDRLKWEQSEIDNHIEAERQRMHAKGVSGHSRLPDNLAHFLAGLRAFARFAESLGVEDVDQWIERGEELLRMSAERQTECVKEASPVHVFLTHIRSALESGQCHLLPKNGKPFVHAGQFGWSGGNSDSQSNGSPQGSCIGYIDQQRESVFLLPEQAVSVVRKSAENANLSFNLTSRSLGDALQREGLLQRSDDSRSTTKIMVKGKRGRYWVLPLSTLAEGALTVESEEDELDEIRPDLLPLSIAGQSGQY